MLLNFDIDLKKLVLSPGGTAELTEITAKRGEEEEIAIRVIQNSTAIELPADAELKFVAKESLHFDEDPLVEAVDFEYDSVSGLYRASVNWIIDVINALFGVKSDTPVTITGGVHATDLITTSGAHGLTAGTRVYFPSLTGGLGLERGTTSDIQRYFVIASGLTTTDFKVSATANGAAVDFTTTITAGTVCADPEDVASIALAIEVAHRADDTSAWKRSENQVALTLLNNYLRDDDGAAALAAQNAVESFVTARAVRFDLAQSLSGGAKTQAIQNLGGTAAGEAMLSAANAAAQVALLRTSLPVELGIACSDESSAISTGTGKATFRLPFAMTLTAVRASVKTAPVTTALVIDINENGTTVLSTKLSIDAGEKTSTTAAAAAVISDAALADDAEITVDFDQVGTGTTGAGVKVWLIGKRAA